MTKKTFAAIVANQKFRGCDAFGCGHYAASRDGGSRSHNGVDVITTPGQAIMSPIAGTVIRYPFPYGNDLRWTGILIENKDYSVKMFYLTPTALQGTKVTQGQIIGKSQNIASKYGSAMTNHVHVEVTDRKTGKLVNPANLF
ncbi:M23 family metallopeptidase [Flavobacterium sp. UBA4197]|uniref:M23 family metallopeptidase n=1 Tax=Flavobacterium sp. UBA4197 TaxID=1946546 RepID=UPI00257E0BA3|nr:M23 family metallopeptidase [Flavobacterium sp. UBA4197]HRB72445.1 M23 family metallopeptidase [Flavobacterium sp.]